MADGTVVAICISPIAGELMQHVGLVRAITGAGLSGDRYANGEGSYNKGRRGKRQVTLINGILFEDTIFEYADSRRNIVTEGVELMDLIGKKFRIGHARMHGIKYCDPCNRPSKLSGKKGFQKSFHDRGGLVAEVIESGIIKVGDEIVPPKKDY